MDALCRIHIAEMQSGKIQKMEKNWVQDQNALQTSHIRFLLFVARRWRTDSKVQKMWESQEIVC